MNARIKKKQAKIKAEKFIEPSNITKRAQQAAAKARYYASLRAPRMYEGKLSNNADYYATIKKYYNYLNKGLITESSNLDKYETADAFYNSLSPREQANVMLIANKKAEEIIERERRERETFADRISKTYSF